MPPKPRTSDHAFWTGAVVSTLGTFSSPAKAQALPACQLILQSGLPEGLSELEPPRPIRGWADGARPVAHGRLRHRAVFRLHAHGGMRPGGDGHHRRQRRKPGRGGACLFAAQRVQPVSRLCVGRAGSVAEAQRGKGLGSFINARMIVSAFERLGASHVYELISAANLPSRRMAEACGLRHEAGLVCGIAVREGGRRFTR